MSAEGEGEERGKVIRLPPASRRWPRPTAGVRDLGLTPLSKALGSASVPKGHWCERCKGIWYSHLGEARCPVCGSR